MKTLTFFLALGAVWVFSSFNIVHINKPAPQTAPASSEIISSVGDLFLPLIVHLTATPSPPTAPAQPSWSSPIATSPLDGSVWTVNPDAGSVSVIHGEGLRKIAEIPVGQEPWSLAISADGKSVYVVDRAQGALVKVDVGTRTVQATLPVGPEPGTVALSPSGALAYVTLMAADAVVVVDTDQLESVAQVSVARQPYALAVTNDGDDDDSDEQVYVTHRAALLRPGGAEAADDGRQGAVTVIHAATHSVIRRIDLPPNQHGFPSRMVGITLSGERAWLPHERAAPALPNGLTTTLFAAISSLDLRTGQEDQTAFIPLNDQAIFGSPVNNPAAAVPSPDGEMLYIVLSGSNLVEVVNVTDPERPKLVRFLPVGHAPEGMSLSRDGRFGYVMSYLSRTISVLDLQELAEVAEVQATDETLSPEVLRGKILFNGAANPRMTQGSWISCASCHFDGWSDDITWIFPDGPRQTPMLWNAGETLPWHWSAALDEAQDVEDTIQVIQRGLGLAYGADPPLLGPPIAGRSPDLDDLAAFLTQGFRLPNLPKPETDVQSGRAIFISSGCQACHGGAQWTASALSGAPGTLDPDGNGMADSSLRQVGTLNDQDLRGETGFDPPSLLGVGLTSPYLHDGSMPTLDALLKSGHPSPPDGPGLDDSDVAALVAFLRSIGPDTPPILPP